MDENKIIEILKNRFDKDEISRDMNLRKDFKVDSISLLEMIMDIEDEFNIEIDTEAIAGFNTVGDLIDYFKEN